MTTRTHLSIGEVLSLLTDDFPDLTITKIRFLESQGLINPERTASGYRKFYEADIERLRWILRQQRENFLPLKVIKDRLDRSEGKRTDDADPDGPEQAELDLARDPGSADPPPVWMADHAASQEPADVPPVNESSNGTDVATASGATADPGPPAPNVPTTPPAAKPKTGDGTDSDEPATGPKATIAAPPPAKSDRTTATSGETSMATSEPAKPSTTPVPADSGDVSDVSMTTAELLGAAGLTARQLEDLESYGIVVGTERHGEPLYDAHALVCARHAATFLELGVEPRHLRAFKIAADREAGLYEQLLLPLLRQRNPAARSEANRLLGRLTSSGTALHGALLQQSLRAQLRRQR